MFKSDIEITSAGKTVFEATMCGLPCITIKIAKNHSNIVKFFLENDIISHVGSFSNKNFFENIVTQIQQL